jgi:hypothetical protein
VSAGRRLAQRTLPGLLRYKFLHEYGYDKGALRPRISIRVA